MSVKNQLSNLDSRLQNLVASDLSSFKEDINGLFNQISDWIKQYDPLLKISTKNIQITEELTGTYTIPELIISNSSTIVKVTPEGIYLAGVKCGVILSCNKKIQIALIDEKASKANQLIKTYNSEKERKADEERNRKRINEIDFEWKIINNDYTFTKLDYDSFINAYNQVIL